MRSAQWFRRGQARLRVLPDLVVDAALAVLLAAVSLSSQWLVDPEMVTFGSWDWDGPSPTSVAVALAANLPLSLRRRFPEAVLVTVGAVSLIGVALTVPEHGFGLFLALYSVAAYSKPTVSYTALAVFVAGTLWALVMIGAVQLFALQLVVFVTAWALGRQAQARRKDAAELQRRAEQLERDREDRARVAVVDERTRIARELHDVIAHSVSVMVVQATAAGRHVRSDPERAEQALEEVADTGRGSLEEMRRLVGLLKDGEQTLSPQPGVTALRDLVAEFREAGLPVGLRVEGDARPLPASADLSAYRIVQEALTNTLQHAGSATARVTLRYGDETVEVEVTDNGTGAPGEQPVDGTGGGHGIPGMRERAALVGGRLECGPMADRGYRVHAVLPTGTA